MPIFHPHNKERLSQPGVFPAAAAFFAIFYKYSGYQEYPG